MNIQDLHYAIQICYNADIPLMLWGDTGVGKSTVIKDYFDKKGIPLVSLYASQFEGVELRGLPYIGDGKVKFAPLHELPTDKRFILFVDEINRGSSSTIQALYQLINDRKIGDRSYNCYVIAACNSEDNFDVTHLDDALLSRFLHISVISSASAVIEYLSQKCYVADCPYSWFFIHNKFPLGADVKVPKMKKVYARQIEWSFQLFNQQKEDCIPKHIYEELLYNLFPQKASHDLILFNHDLLEKLVSKGLSVKSVSSEDIRFILSSIAQYYKYTRKGYQYIVKFLQDIYICYDEFKEQVLNVVCQIYGIQSNIADNKVSPGFICTSITSLELKSVIEDTIIEHFTQDSNIKKNIIKLFKI